MKEVTLEKFLYDYSLVHEELNGVFDISKLNFCIDKLRRSLDIHVNFTKNNVSSLINRMNGLLKWEHGKLICGKDYEFRPKILEYVHDYYVLGIDTPLEKGYKKIISEINNLKVRI